MDHSCAQYACVFCFFLTAPGNYILNICCPSNLTASQYHFIHSHSLLSDSVFAWCLTFLVSLYYSCSACLSMPVWEVTLTISGLVWCQGERSSSSLPVLSGKLSFTQDSTGGICPKNRDFCCCCCWCMESIWNCFIVLCYRLSIIFQFFELLWLVCDMFMYICGS